MRLIDIALEVERVLKDNNVSWRYVSSRNARTFILEDGSNCVLTMRYDPILDNYFLHETLIHEGSVNLDTDYRIIHGTEYLEDLVKEII